VRRRVRNRPDPGCVDRGGSGVPQGYFVQCNQSDCQYVDEKQATLPAELRHVRARFLGGLISSRTWRSSAGRVACSRRRTGSRSGCTARNSLGDARTPPVRRSRIWTVSDTTPHQNRGLASAHIISSLRARSSSLLDPHLARPTYARSRVDTIRENSTSPPATRILSNAAPGFRYIDSTRFASVPTPSTSKRIRGEGPPFVRLVIGVLRAPSLG